MKYWLGLLLLGCTSLLSAQYTASVRIESGTASTTCSTSGAPNPVWAINVENEGWQYLGQQGACAGTLPFVAWEQTYGCAATPPTEVEICFQAFDNGNTDCSVAPSCAETICNTFSLPSPGNSTNSSLAVSGISSGTVNFELSLTEVAPPTNDLPCGAIELGALSLGDTLGNAEIGTYNNHCATASGDIQPTDQGAFLFNDAGVWFTFTTSLDAGNLFTVEAISDPENTGDPLDIELLVFRSMDGSCAADQLIYEPNIRYDLSGNDGTLSVFCTQPNTRYYILIDGQNDPPESLEGVFGIEVQDIGVPDAGDLRCEYEDLGTVPANGQVRTDGLRANFCATRQDDPFVRGFSSRNSVWFSFNAPESGHVIIEALSGPAPYGVDIEMALYFSLNDACTGSYRFIRSSYAADSFDETMQLDCLDPGRPYYILIDGSARTPPGTFSVVVSDAGDNRPRVELDTTVCAGTRYQVGNSTYTESGIYVDTLQNNRGCDSIVTTRLTVLQPLSLALQQTDPAIGENGTDGRAEVVVSGGAPAYRIQWCDGTQGPTNTSLVAGATCCVSVVDMAGCQQDTCFVVDFVRPILPTWQDGFVDCFGDTDGVISFSATGGEPPLAYEWATAAGELLGTGTISVEGQENQIPALPGGNYFITIRDAYFDTTFTATISEPPPLRIQLDSFDDASCNGSCDGLIQTSAMGGTGNLSFLWSDGSTDPSRQNLCANTYQVTVTDMQGCADSLEQAIQQPPPFIVTPLIQQQVSCNGGSDGSVVLLTSGQPIRYAWSNGAEDAVVSNLPAGLFTVTVTNIDNCDGRATVEITEPPFPLTAFIAQSALIRCADSQDGALSTAVVGSYSSLFYQWSNGATSPAIDSLGPDTYEVVVENEKGCQAEASFRLEAPDPLSVELIHRDLNCLTGPNGGSVEIISSSGGVTPYVYQLADRTYTAPGIFDGLAADTYTFELKDSLGCILAEEVTIDPPPNITVDLGPDLEIALGDSVQLTAVTNAEEPLFFWQPIDSLSGDRQWIRPRETQSYSVLVEDAISACTAETFVRVFVDKNPRVFLPNAFSPNADGRNDTFLPFGGPDVVAFHNLRIYARNGQLLFEQEELLPNQLESGWDGTIRNQPGNAGVYLFTVEIEFFDGRTEVYSGDVVLVR